MPAESLEANGRFVIVSEPWSWYPGWNVRDGEDELSLRRADGIASAVFVPHASETIVADYAPRSFLTGLLVGAVGLLGALGCLFVRPRAA